MFLIVHCPCKYINLLWRVQLRVQWRVQSHVLLYMRGNWGRSLGGRRPSCFTLAGINLLQWSRTQEEISVIVLYEKNKRHNHQFVSSVMHCYPGQGELTSRLLSTSAPHHNTVKDCQCWWIHVLYLIYAVYSLIIFIYVPGNGFPSLAPRVGGMFT